MRKLLLPLICVAFLCAVTFSIVSTGVANAQSIRNSSGYTGEQTHVTWAGPDVGIIAWTTAADFNSWTWCHSSWASVAVDAAWNSESLHNGAELDMMFSVHRSDGRHFQLGNVLKITEAQPWPGHPAFGGQFRASVYTPAGMYLKYATVTSWIVNGEPPATRDTVLLKQWTKSC